MERNDQKARSGGADGEQVGEEISLVAVVNAVLRHRRAVLWPALVLGIAVGVLTLLQARTYAARASFVPQVGGGRLAQFSVLAAQLGVAMPNLDGEASPAFYAALISSRELLSQAVHSRYVLEWNASRETGTLVTLLEASGKDSAARAESAVRSLRSALRVSIDRETGIVEVRLRSRSPALSQGIVERMLTLLAEFDQGKRQSRAAAERKFVEARLHEADSTLQAAEARLQLFLQRNREFKGSPQLAFEHDRLQRAVAMRQQVFSSLAQAYEQARIDEVRNTPVFTIVEPPRASPRPTPRWLALKVLLVMLVGGVIGVYVAITRDAMARWDRDEVEVAEFRALREEAMGGIRSVAQRVRRAVAGSPKGAR